MTCSECGADNWVEGRLWGDSHVGLVFGPQMTVLATPVKAHACAGCGFVRFIADPAAIRQAQTVAAEIKRNDEEARRLEAESKRVQKDMGWW